MISQRLPDGSAIKITPNYAASIQKAELPPAGAAGRAASGILQIKPMGGFAQALSQLRGALYQPPNTTIAGVDAVHWPSALQPTTPMAPKDSQPLYMPFFHGQNLFWTPRADATYSAMALKELATYDLVRVIIENVKDQICQTPFQIQVKQKPGESKSDWKGRQKGDQTLLQLQRFFEYPDSEHNWQEWLRPLLDDLLVIDAPAVHVRRTLKRQVGELRVLRGESIVRYIDDNGATPSAPSPAYAQLWYGIPRVNLSVDQLVYKPRNIVPRGTVASHLYGMSPVEQAATWIKTGVERLKWQLMNYTEASVPGVIHVVPPGVPPQKVQEAMDLFNSDMTGDTAKRLQWRMLQGFREDKDDQIIMTKEHLMADPFDDLIIRCLCFAFGTSPQRLMRMMNRATAQANQEAADIEGYLPIVTWLKGYIDYIINRVFWYQDYQIAFDPQKEQDVVKQMTADTGYVNAGIKSREEVREDLGMEGSGNPVAGELTTTGQPVIVIGQAPPCAPGTDDPNKDVDPNKMDRPKPGAKLPQNLKIKVHKANGSPLPAKFNHMAKYKSFFAYDPDSQTAYVKGDVDVDVAVTALRNQFEELENLAI